MTEAPRPVEQWWTKLVQALGIEPTTTADEVLELAAVAAHSVVRPAAPVTTFLVGYAAGLAGGGAEPEARARATAEALLHRHATPTDPT